MARVTATLSRNFGFNLTQKVMKSQKAKDAATVAAQRKVNAAQNAMIKTYNNHPVTKELREGVNATNSIIKYFNEVGNPSLYSFIGFPEGTDVLGLLEEVLNSNMAVKPTISRQKGRTAIFYFRIPEAEKLRENIIESTPMPHDYFTGNISWAQGLEDGDLTGIKNYLTISVPQSRSGGGIQVKFNGNFGSSIERVKYITEILDAFREKLQSLIK